MTVAQLKASMSSEEFSHWIAFYIREQQQAAGNKAPGKPQKRKPSAKTREALERSMGI